MPTTAELHAYLESLLPSKSPASECPEEGGEVRVERKIIVELTNGNTEDLGFRLHMAGIAGEVSRVVLRLVAPGYEDGADLGIRIDVPDLQDEAAKHALAVSLRGAASLLLGVSLAGTRNVGFSLCRTEGASP